MALPLIPGWSISKSQIRDEYGGSDPASLSQYYRGGSLVKAHGNNTGIPSGGTISYSQFSAQSRIWYVNVTISSDYNQFNLRNYLNATYGDYSSAATVATVTINSGVWVYSSTTSAPAFDTGGSWASGSGIYIVNNGYIAGKGGDGGFGGAESNSGFGAAAAGGAGGNAINLQYGVTINNYSGYILGGGGGGGGGGQIDFYYNSYHLSACGGGGGGGTSYSSSGGGSAGWYVYLITPPPYPNGGSSGGAGTTSGGGGGGTRGYQYQQIPGETTLEWYWYGGNGGAGGGWGSAGNAGDASSGVYTNSGSPYYYGGWTALGGAGGGAGGKAINTNGYGVYFNNGGNNGSQVQGAVS